MDKYDTLIQGWVVATLLDYLEKFPLTNEDVKKHERVKRLLSQYIDRVIL